MSSQRKTNFLKWALQHKGYRWAGFRKPQNQVLKRVEQRIQKLGLSGGYTEYKDYLESNPEEWEVFDALCDVTISRFFRDREIWDYVRLDVLPTLINRETPEKIRVWSAGCCNGEEACSIAMLFDMVCSEAGFKSLDILATDRNEEVLKRAKAGKYPHGSLREMRRNEIENYFQENFDGEEYRVIDRLKKLISFEKRDIRSSLPDAEFDMVFCRNLAFTYFSEKYQHNFLERVSSIIRKDGFLVLGKRETVPNHHLFERVHQNFPVYKKNSSEK